MSAVCPAAIVSLICWASIKKVWVVSVEMVRWKVTFSPAVPEIWFGLKKKLFVETLKVEAPLASPVMIWGDEPEDADDEELEQAVAASANITTSDAMAQMLPFRMTPS